MRGLKRVFDAILDAVLPRRERSMRTSLRALEEIPLCPTVHELLGERIITLMDYRKAEVQDLIRALKYDRSTDAAHLAAQALSEYLREELASQKLFTSSPVFIAPVPLHNKRSRERGFNQIELVLHELPREFRDGRLATFEPHLLERVRETTPQTKLSRAERLRNVEGAFAMPKGTLPEHAHVFLLDDVTTTGATLKHAAAPLNRAGVQVTLLALARA